MNESEQVQQITDREEYNGSAFQMEGGDIIREDGTCAGYTSLDFQQHYHDLQAALTTAEQERDAARLAGIDLMRAAQPLRDQLKAANKRAEDYESRNKAEYYRGEELNEQLTAAGTEIALLRQRAALADEAKPWMKILFAAYQATLTEVGEAEVRHWIARYDALPAEPVQADMTSEANRGGWVEGFTAGIKAYPNIQESIKQIAQGNFGRPWREITAELGLEPAAGSQP